MVDWTKPIWCKPEKLDLHLVGMSSDRKRAIAENPFNGSVYSADSETGRIIGGRLSNYYITNKPTPPAWPGVQEWPKPFSLMFQRCGQPAVFLGRDKDGEPWVAYQEQDGDLPWNATCPYEDGSWVEGGEDPRDLRNAEPGELEGLERKAGA